MVPAGLQDAPWKGNGGQILATTYALSQGAPGNTALNGAFFGTEKVTFNPALARMAIPLPQPGPAPYTIKPAIQLWQATAR